MTLQQVTAGLETWQRKLLDLVAPLFVKARADLMAVQAAPEADERIEKIQALLTARLEPIFLEAEAGLEPLRQAVDRYFETAAEPTEADSATQEKVGNALEHVREIHRRKIESLVAQARAQDLTGGAPAPSGATAGAPAPPRFCRQCGAPTT